MQVDEQVGPGAPVAASASRPGRGPGLMLAVVAATFYLLLAVGESIGEWLQLQETGAGGDGSGAAPLGEMDFGAAAAVPSICLFLAALGLVGVSMTDGRWVRPRFRPGHRPPGRTCRWSGLWPAMAVLPALGTVGALVWHYARQAFPGQGGLDAADPLAGLTEAWSVSAVAITVLTSGAAAIGEEVLALAIPIWGAGKIGRWLGVSARWRQVGLWAVGALLVAVRMAYHLYQGGVAMAHLPWAIGTVVLYVHTRRLVPIVLSHFAIGVTLPLGRAAHPSTVTGFLIVCAGPTLALAVLLLVWERRRPDRRTAPAPAS